MRKFILPLAVLFLAAIPAKAQDEYPTVEIFGGYSYLSVDVGADFDDDDFDINNREGFHGVGVSVAGNVSKSFGIVGDFSYNRKSIADIVGFSANANVTLFLFGPRFTARGDKVDGFVHALIGGARQRISVDLPGENINVSDTNLALGFGGGVDVKAGDMFAVRLFQIDYIPIRSEDPFTGDKQWSHNFRFQIGAVVRF
jgi:hypothetical protein